MKFAADVQLNAMKFCTHKLKNVAVDSMKCSDFVGVGCVVVVLLLLLFHIQIFQQPPGRCTWELVWTDANAGIPTHSASCV